MGFRIKVTRWHDLPIAPHGPRSVAPTKFARLLPFIVLFVMLLIVGWIEGAGTTSILRTKEAVKQGKATEQELFRTRYGYLAALLGVGFAAVLGVRMCRIAKYDQLHYLRDYDAAPAVLESYTGRGQRWESVEGKWKYKRTDGSIGHHVERFWVFRSWHDYIHAIDLEGRQDVILYEPNGHNSPMLLSKLRLARIVDEKLPHISP